MRTIEDVIMALEISVLYLFPWIITIYGSFCFQVTWWNPSLLELVEIAQQSQREVRSYKVPWWQLYLQRTSLICLFAYHLHFCPHTCQSALAASKSGSPLGKLGQRKTIQGDLKCMKPCVFIHYFRENFWKTILCEDIWPGCFTKQLFSF